MGWVSNDDHDAKMVQMNWLVGPDKSFQTIFHAQQRYMVTTLVLFTSWSHQIKFAGTKLSYYISQIFGYTFLQIFFDTSIVTNELLVMPEPTTKPMIYPIYNWPHDSPHDQFQDHHRD